MSHWKSVKAKQLLSALLRIGWEVDWQKGSHRHLKRAEWPKLHICVPRLPVTGAGSAERHQVRSKTMRPCETRWTVASAFMGSNPRNHHGTTRSATLA